MEIHTKSTPGKLIGLTGYATCGKDAVADILVEKYGYKKYGFADRMYSMALEINPWIRDGWRPRRLADIVRCVGWTEAKRIKSVRSYLQWIGTDVGRKHLGQDVWINSMMPQVMEDMRNGHNVVITNCRYENEAIAIEDAGGCIVLVERPGVGPANSHSSESGECFERAVFRIINDGDLSDLEEWADALEACIAGTHPDNEANILPFLHTIRRGMANGLRLVLNVAAPASVATEDWMKRHRVMILPLNEGIEVFVDGESAGRVRYSDNILEIDARIAR
jgi:hypothetical protein